MLDRFLSAYLVTGYASCERYSGNWIDVFEWSWLWYVETLMETETEIETQFETETDTETKKEKKTSSYSYPQPTPLSMIGVEVDEKYQLKPIPSRLSFTFFLVHKFIRHISVTKHQETPAVKITIYQS